MAHFIVCLAVFAGLGLTLAAPVVAQVTCQHIGSQTFCSNGQSYQHFGNQTFDNRGNSWQHFGNSTFGSNGRTCTRIGSSTFCN